MSRTRVTRCCDTSVLVPALLDWHSEHERSRAALAAIHAVPAHVLIECYSVLTRLPATHRLNALEAAAVLRAQRLEVVALPGEDHADLVGRMANLGVSGGATYDGLVAATAKHHELTLVTRDQRARRIYDAVGARYTLM